MFEKTLMVIDELTEKFNNNLRGAQGVLDRWEVILTASSMIMCMYTDLLFDKTLAHWSIILPFILSGILLAVFGIKFIKRGLGLYFVLGFNLFSTGLMAFLFINDHWADRTVPARLEKYEIIEISRHRNKSCHYLSYEIKTDYGTKELEFRVPRLYEIDDENFGRAMELSVYDGLFGLPVFDKASLREKKSTL